MVEEIIALGSFEISELVPELLYSLNDRYIALPMCTRYVLRCINNSETHPVAPSDGLRSVRGHENTLLMHTYILYVSLSI